MDSLKEVTAYIPTKEESFFKVVTPKDDEDNSMSCFVEQKQGYFNSKDEMIELLGSAFDAGIDFTSDDSDFPMALSKDESPKKQHPDKEEFIKTIIQQ